MGRRKEGRRPETLSLAVSACVCMSHGWKGLFPPGHFKHTRGMLWPGMAALRVRGSAGGLGWGGKAGMGGRGNSK